MAGELDALAQQITATVGTENSAAQFIAALHVALNDAIANNDLPRIVSLTQQLKDSQATLAAAIAANPLPSAPETPSEDPPQ